MAQGVNEYLTTRATLQRIAKALGINSEQENHSIASDIETRISRLRGYLMHAKLYSSKPLQCTICGDDIGPLLMRDGTLICESCDTMLANASISSEARS